MTQMDDPLKAMKDDLFRQLRNVAKDYGGPGEAIEETLMGLWKNSTAAGIRHELRALGVGDREIEWQAFREMD